MFERFSQRFGTSIPNPSLAPERARQIEVGGSTKLGTASLEGAAFHALVTNAIVSESVLGYVNAALKAEYELRRGISISASARNLFDDKYQLADGFPEAGRGYQLALKAAY